MAEEKKAPSRSEKEAKIKDKAGWVITVVAALLAVNTYLGNGNSGKILNNTILANDTWAFYQAKSIKQSIAEMAYDNAIEKGDKKKAEKLAKKIERYESDPEKGEGKKELMVKAKKLEEERLEAKKRSPWYTFAGTAFQLSIVLLSASILAVNIGMFWASVGVGAVGFTLMMQALYSFI